MPDVRLVDRQTLATLAGTAVASLFDRSLGTNGTVFVSDALSVDETVRTVLHEFSHAYEHRHGWAPDERFARGQEQTLMDEWCHPSREASV
jgi:hypothetical protein